MSVINQMLKDLQERSTQAVPPETVLTGLQPAAGQERGRKKYYWLLLALFFLVLVWTWNFISYFHAHHELPSQAQTVHPASSRPERQTVSVIEKRSQPAKVDHGVLTGITMQSHGKMTYLRFVLDREVFYQVNSDPLEHSITLTLKRTQLQVNLPPLDYLHSALQDLKIRPEKNGELAIILMLKPEAKLSNLELNKESKYPELQADFLMEASDVLSQTLIAPSPEPTPKLKKIAVTSSRDEQYEEALELVEKGQLSSAVRHLTQLIQQDPLDHEAREALIQLFIQEGNQDRAETLLNAGLRLQPYYPPFLQAKARLLVDAGKINQALNLLKKAPPALAAYPEYYAFMAALYQRLGQLSSAENIYQQLTLLHPEKGVWWLGLGITEEGLGKTAQAMEAYARADSSPELDPELRGYVGTRLRG